MRSRTRVITVLFAVLGAASLAHADGEGGPGDSGVGGSTAAASAASASRQAHKMQKSSHKAGASTKRMNGPADAASGPKADGPMSNSTNGKGG